MTTQNELESLRKGDKVIFRRIFESMYGTLCCFAQKYVDDSGLAEDWVQEVFIKLWEKRETIDSLETLKGYLYVSLRNKACQYFRHQKIVDRYTKEEIRNRTSSLYFKNHLIEEETFRLLHASMKLLPDQTHRVCLLSVDGLKNSQIAEELNISVNTVKYHKKKAYSFLRESLSEEVLASLALLYFF
ncbi:MAG: RNA polymerase sigma-70 factor [Cytophagales bacterium]|nr:RNA polymerase sigma-70 factor [Cytophagales bacterium]